MALTSQIRKTVLYILFKNYKAVSVVLALFILGIGFLVVLYPKYQGISRQGLLDFGNKKEQLDERQNYLGRLEKMVEEYNSINQEKINDLKQFLPDSQEIPELFVMVDQLGRDMGLTVTQITITPQSVVPISNSSTSEKKSTASAPWALAAQPDGQPGAVYTTPTQLGSVSIVFSLEGEDLNYSKFKKMLETIEENIRIFDLNSIDYSPDQKGFTLNVTTYYLVS